ncbi:hypothetical protein [Polyangium spumosum]|uniref:Uncharacterized protein n=1 Tax=Polyangium spumosum TaxID=889282 RepID=A0A6N7PYT0_9BACT|nr:hypothetical protein [Polyangium spumosum]MRG93881.1 hypothetical protein [Polyangium spumosum]
MIARIEQKKQHRLCVLNRLYDETDGDTHAYVIGDQFFDGFTKEGISPSDAESAFRWLADEGLAKFHGSLLMIKHQGVVEIEQSREAPDEDTDHFPAAVIHQVNHFHGTVGGVQTGSHNTMSVAQQINAPAEIIGHFAALREAAQRLPEDKRSTAIEMVEGLEEEAKLDKPRKGRVESYGKTLVSLLVTMGPIIKMIVDWIATKH